MIQISSKVTRNRMRTLSKQGQKAAARRNVEIANDAAVIARQLVPVLSGDLKSTIAVMQDLKTGSASLTAGGIAESGNLVDYAGPVEWGPYNQPFITPAMESAAKRSRNRRITMYR